MNDIVLWDVAELSVEGSQVTVVILTIVENFAFMSGSQATESINQHRFTGAGATNNGNKFTWGNRERDVVEQSGVVVAVFFEVECVDANKITLVVLCQLGAFEDELIRSDANFVTHLEEVVGDKLGIDIDMVGTTQIKDAIGSSFTYHTRVVRRNLWM